MEDPKVHLPSVKEMLFVIPDLLVLLLKKTWRRWEEGEMSQTQKNQQKLGLDWRIKAKGVVSGVVVDTRMKKMKSDGGMKAAEEEWENWKPSPTKEEGGFWRWWTKGIKVILVWSQMKRGIFVHSRALLLS